MRSHSGESLWRVEVEDQGPGVPNSEHEHIFDRFVRLQTAPTVEREGSGLGLAICRGIIELHHGRIFAESGAGGRGLRVVFEVPARARTMAPTISDTIEAASSSGAGCPIRFSKSAIESVIRLTPASKRFLATAGMRARSPESRSAAAIP